jgi:hypothetical protein
MGHYAVVCPTKDQKFTVVCEEELPHQKLGVHNLAPVEEHHEGVKEEVEEEILESSSLPVCVIRRILARQGKEDKVEEEWLRNNIFHTRVGHKGKALNVIIDNDSGMNVASQETVQKLKLPLEKHWVLVSHDNRGHRHKPL